jgi:hypothetical protein
MKQCRVCDQVKDESEFYPAAKGRLRLRNECKVCHRAALRDHSQDTKPAGRICTVCSLWKPLSAFHKYRLCLYGVEPFCKVCKLEKRQIRRTLYPDAERRIRLKYEYGITLEVYEAMHARQGGRCAICGRAEAKLVVDHEHGTGRVCSLLCHLCNAMIGCAREDAAILAAGIGYLRRHAEGVSADLLGAGIVVASGAGGTLLP